MSLYSILNDFTPYEFAVGFIAATSMSFWGISVNINDSVKIGIIAILSMFSAKYFTRLITEETPPSKNYQNQAVYDQNERNMRTILADL